jgi:membrane dipeptidase
MTATGAPRVDIHAHPGRCFLAGLGADDPLGNLMGGQDVAAALAAAREAGMAAVTLSTVADLRVLAPDPVKGLRASREFAPGEAYADHRRQLAGIGEVLGVPVAVTAEDIDAA